MLCCRLTSGDYFSPASGSLLGLAKPSLSRDDLHHVISAARLCGLTFRLWILARFSRSPPSKKLEDLAYSQSPT
jgi:hypothetical protein